MHAKDIMTREVFTVRSDDTVFDAAQLMVNACISAAPVVDAGGQLVGVISEADLMNRVEIETAPERPCLLGLLASDTKAARAFIRSHALRVTDVMRKDVVTTREEAPLGEIAALMKTHHVKRIPVVRGDRIVGIVSRANLLQGLLANEPRPAASATADPETRAAVVAELGKYSWSQVYPTNVIVQDGVVHLWGYASSGAVRDAYRVAAERIVGVSRVENHMLIMPAMLPYGV